MGRPVNADAAATQRRILESATMLFGERGDKSSIREIAKTAGVSLAMVHHYFGSKDDLYTACVDAMYQELARLRVHLLAEVGTSPGPEAIEKAIREGFRFARDHQREMRLMMRSVVARGALDTGRAEEFLVPFLDRASQLVAALTGASPQSLRLPLQSHVFLTGRYAIADDTELRLITQTETGEAALNTVSDHLVAHAFLVLGLPNP